MPHSKANVLIPTCLVLIIVLKGHIAVASVLMGQSIHWTTQHGPVDRVDGSPVVGRHHVGVGIQLLIPVSQALDPTGAGGF